MKIRASVLTPVLAMLTVAALIGTGIVLGQAHRGDADATLLDATPNFTTAAGTDATVVADTEPAADGGDPTEQPTEQTAPETESASAGPVVAGSGQGSSGSTATTTWPPTKDPSPKDPGDAAKPGEEIDQPSQSDDESDEYDEHAAKPHHDEDVDSDSHETEHD